MVTSILDEPNIGVDELNIIVCELDSLEMKTCALGCIHVIWNYMFTFLKYGLKN